MNEKLFYIQKFYLALVWQSLRQITQFHLISWCGNFAERQFPQSFGRIARTSAKTVFPQNLHIRKFGEITGFYVVNPSTKQTRNGILFGHYIIILIIIKLLVVNYFENKENVVFAKCTILDIWQGSEYAHALHFCLSIKHENISSYNTKFNPMW